LILFFFLLLSIFLTLGGVRTAFDRSRFSPDLGVYATLLPHRCAGTLSMILFIERKEHQ
jgi:hypothetical protein